MRVCRRHGTAPDCTKHMPMNGLVTGETRSEVSILCIVAGMYGESVGVSRLCTSVLGYFQCIVRG